MKKLLIILFSILVIPVNCFANDKYKIEKKGNVHISNSKNKSQAQGCIVRVQDLWKKNIDYNLESLKEVTTEEQFKLILDSQTTWEEAYKKDKQIMSELVINGTGKKNLMINEEEQILKSRSNFLMRLYEILSENN